VKKLTVTSHQLCEKFKYIPGQFGVDFLWISVDFGENGVDFGENGQVLTPTDETFEWGVGGPSVDLEWIWGPLLSISVDLGSILVTFWWIFGASVGLFRFWASFWGCRCGWNLVGF
jgi:hypothetical protein